MPGFVLAKNNTVQKLRYYIQVNTGKELQKNGVDPENIAFISYTYAAANEAKKRVSRKFPGLGSLNFPNFSTMHSLATKIGGEKGKELCLEEHWKDLEQWRNNYEIFRNRWCKSKNYNIIP